MIYKKDIFPWSDNWWIENERAWFVAGEYNAIFEVDFKLNKCSLLAEIPNSYSFDFRRNPRCIKLGDYIYCLPDNEDIIWIYNSVNKVFSKLDIPKTNRVAVRYIGLYEKNILIFSYGLQKIYQINSSNELKEVCDLSITAKEIIVDIIIDGIYLYGIGATTGNLFEYNLENKRSKIISTNVPLNYINAICFDGSRIWMSGKRKEIYVWSLESNCVKILKNFPDNFGEYSKKSNGKVIFNNNIESFEERLFINIVYVNNSIWMIPFHTNNILYIDLEQPDVINTFFIPTEEFDINNLWRNYSLEAKYLVQYIKEDRYLALFSLKNDKILQIDTQKKTYEYLDIHLSDIIKDGDVVCYEARKWHRLKFKFIMDKRVSKFERKNIGERIYKRLNDEMR